MGGSGSGGDVPPEHIIMYAPYVEQWHSTWLTRMETLWTQAIAANPYTSLMTPYDPDAALDGMLAALNAYCAVLLNFHNTSLDINVVAAAFDKAKTIETFVPGTAWSGHLSTITPLVDAQLLETTEIDESVNQYSEQLQADIEEKTLPAFEAGMRDINAVMSTSFIIGEALIFAEKNRNVAKYRADLLLAAWADRNKAIMNLSTTLLDADFKTYAAYGTFAEMVGKFWIQGVEFKRQLTDKLIDVLRMKIVAKKEEDDETLRRAIENAKWPMSMSQYPASMLGSAGGGHAVPEGTGGGPTVASVLGGVMAGASIGAMFNGETGGAWGSAIGGVAGGIAGAFA